MANEENNGEGGDGSQPALITIDAIKTAGVPESYFKDGAYDFATIGKDLGELTTMRTANAERAKAIPQDGKYDFALPKDWKAPDGLNLPKEFVESWKVSESKVAQFAPLAKELGLSQAQVSKFVATWATAEAAEKFAAEKAGADFVKAEMAKLGSDEKASRERAAKIVQAYTAEKGPFGKSLGIAFMRGVETADEFLAAEKFFNDLSSKLAAKGTGNGADKPHQELADQIGKVGIGRKLLDAANAVKN